MNNEDSLPFSLHTAIVVILVVAGTGGKTMSELCDELKKLSDGGLIENPGLRRIPGGLYCEDVGNILSSWIGQSWCAESDQGKLSLTLPGMQYLAFLVRQEFVLNKKRFGKVADIVDFDREHALSLFTAVV